MILVNIPKTWPKVLAGEANAADITLGSWAQLMDEDLEAHADSILGIYKNTIVTAFDIESWTREGNRVRFVGKPSEKWAHLIGEANPGKPWLQGMARPVQVLPTAILTGGNVPVENTPSGRRAVIEGFVLTVEDETATLQVPAGGKVTVSLLATK